MDALSELKDIAGKLLGPILVCEDASKDVDLDVLLVPKLDNGVELDLLKRTYALRVFTRLSCSFNSLRTENLRFS
jgi:hypothetical protein